MRNFATMLLFVLSMSRTNAQDSIEYRGTLVYMEIGGNSAPIIGLNIERRIFAVQKWFGNIRAGYGALRFDGITRWAVPVGVNIFRGINTSHIELGVGLTYGEGLHSSTVGNVTRINKALYFVPSLGYRFQKTTGGLFLRAAYTPLLKLKEYSTPESWFHEQRLNQYFGLSIGYFFAKAK